MISWAWGYHLEVGEELARRRRHRERVKAGRTTGSEGAEMGTRLSPSSQVNPALRQRWLSPSSVLANKPSHVLLSSPHDIFSVAENYS